MKKLSNQLRIALDAREKGVVAIPCRAQSKIPVVKWKAWQQQMPPLELQMRWFDDERVNIAILTTGMVVYDCERIEELDLVIAHCGDTPHKVRTPGGGIHLGYRKPDRMHVANRVKILGLPIDIRSDGGLEMIPNSELPQGRYEWLGPGLLPISELPLAAIAWTVTRLVRDESPSTAIIDLSRPHEFLYRGQRYVDTFERAISGCNGHTATFIAALKVVTFASRDPQLAWQLLLHFNATKCEPQWSERELRHKLNDALLIAN